ncbi:two-component sensor histidine kinase [Planococcus lenghuensis]|uniref:histidine kinase n=2 Tax=Planococcus lenghuensis TaxID=2213202 RepID=A0A1Q2L3H8_9BACL|nr:two-component sensor histidine kinase [Planococcus lenghuensis]
MINNFFFIIFPIVLYQLFAIAGRQQLFSKHKIILTALFSISSVLCVLFPYQFLSEDYIFDLRQVPLIVGGLYGGPAVSAVIFVVTSAVRIGIGGDGMYIAVLNLLLVAVVVPLLRNFYLRMGWLAKILFVFLVSITSLLFNLVAGHLLFGDPIHHIVDVWLMLMLNQGMIAAIAALLIERIQRQEYMLNALIKHEKLETVSHFAASVSHELRNPIQSIKGFVQLLNNHEYDRDRQTEFHNTILQEINAAEKLIEDYLIFAKPAYGRIETIHTKSEIEKIMNILGPYAAEREIKIVLTAPEDGLRIAVDPQKFQQAVINIIRNGIDAMPAGGLFSIVIQREKSAVLIKLTDSGSGMTKEEIQRLGEPYFSTKTTGTGLGMMVTYSVISQMHGEIDVISEKGQGTTFTLTFAAAE